MGYQVRRIKSMKRILILIISLLFAMPPVAMNVCANTTSLLSVSSETVKSDETVSVSVKISDNPGIAAYAVKLNFDKAALCPVSISGAGVTSNIQQDNVNKEQLDFVTAIWSSESNRTDDGVLFTVEFAVKSGYVGSTELTLSYDDGDICNQLLEDVKPQTVGGTVTVTSSPTVPPEPVEFSIKYDEKGVVVTAPRAGEYYVIAAAYSGGRLSSVEIASVSFENAGSENIPLDRLNKDGADSIKLMLWSGLDTMMSLCIEDVNML